MKPTKFAKWTFGTCAALAMIALVVVTRPMGRGGEESPARNTDSLPQSPPPEVTDLSTGIPESEIPADSSFAPNQFADRAQPGWTVVNRNAIAPDRLPPYQETYTDARLVSLAGNLGNWGPGSRVVFDIPHTGERLESVIERVESGLAGSVSYIGRVDRDDVLQRIVVTVGARNAFAFIDSDNGSYEMVGNREFGWLMSTVGMERHVDYSKPDYYVPGDFEPDNP